MRYLKLVPTVATLKPALIPEMFTGSTTPLVLKTPVGIDVNRFVAPCTAPLVDGNVASAVMKTSASVNRVANSWKSHVPFRSRSMKTLNWRLLAGGEKFVHVVAPNRTCVDVFVTPTSFRSASSELGANPSGGDVNCGLEPCHSNAVTSELCSFGPYAPELTPVPARVMFVDAAGPENSTSAAAVDMFEAGRAFAYTGTRNV